MRIFLVLLLITHCLVAQSLSSVETLWKQAWENPTSEALSVFNAAVVQYVRANGADWQIRYLTGSLYCHVPALRATGLPYLESILPQVAGLDPRSAVRIQRQIAACASTAAVVEASANEPQSIAGLIRPGIRGHTKGGANVRFAHDPGVIGPKENYNRDLSKFLVPVSDANTALKQAITRLTPERSGIVVGQFAVIAGTPDLARRLGACLNRYVPMLKSQYSLELPQKMISVFAADSPEQVSRIAYELHDMDLPDGVIAYSVLDDLTLVSTYSPDGCGSMAHELVHLSMKTSLPNSPAWLEEGIASEVAIAQLGDGRFRYSWQWRDDRLKENFALRPDIPTLVTSVWGRFSPETRDDLARSIAYQAMAAVFIRYLDATGALPAIYSAIREQHLSNTLVGYKTDRTILEQKLGKSLAVVDADFVRWFQSQ